MSDLVPGSNPTRTRREPNERYNFVVKPAWLRPAADRIGTYLLQRDVDRRLAAFVKACADPSIIKQVELFAPDQRRK